MLHGTGGYQLFRLLKRDYISSEFLCLLLVGVTMGPGECNCTVIVQGTKVPQVQNANRYR
jgi:hypothetical protein